MLQVTGVGLEPTTCGLKGQEDLRTIGVYQTRNLDRKRHSSLLRIPIVPIETNGLSTFCLQSPVAFNPPIPMRPTAGTVYLEYPSSGNNNQTPGGSVDQLRMQRLHASATATFQARYSFAADGLYLVTAEGRAGKGAHVRTVSVTARAVVGQDMHGGGHDWLMPAAVLGGLGMLAMMAI